jgi:hypothetical protein
LAAVVYKKLYASFEINLEETAANILTNYTKKLYYFPLHDGLLRNKGADAEQHQLNKMWTFSPLKCHASLFVLAVVCLMMLSAAESV